MVIMENDSFTAINEMDEKEEVEQIENHEKEWESNVQDPFTSFMFGPPRRHLEREKLHEDSQINQPMINYEELMIHIDTLWESIQGLKPLFKKFSPFVEQFWKKNKLP